MMDNIDGDLMLLWGALYNAYGARPESGGIMLVVDGGKPIVWVMSRQDNGAVIKAQRSAGEGGRITVIEPSGQRKQMFG